MTNAKRLQPMEILAPVGGRAQLLAAVRCGADAVYLGAKGFNARQNAENFERGTLLDAVSYCHARGVSVYVTVNTLVTDDELPALEETLREVAQSGADAVIVQDMAVARMVRACCPELQLHASTQMTIHNTAGAKALVEMGFSRAVLARELTLEEIAQIHAQAAGLELEVFVHGALCMSVSGACYLSSILGGRSGNRGLCAQPCRLDFRHDGRSFALSLKDLSALGHIQGLAEAGVRALKIEGRMKRPEYVAAAVTACRKALAGEPYDLQTLQAVFSRGGFTDGYLMGKRTLDMFGRRTEEDARAAQQAQKQLTGLYQHERPAIAVDMTLTLRTGEAAVLRVSADEGDSATSTGDVPQAARTAPIDHERAWRSLSKTGDSPFCLRTLSLDTEEGLMLPASSLNALRREALSTLLACRETPRPKRFIQEALPAMPGPHVATVPPAMRLRFETPAQLWEDIQAGLIILPLDTIDDDLLAVYGERLAAELPALIFPGEEDRTRQRLRRLRGSGLKSVLCHNLGALAMAREEGLAARGGYGLNILNSQALAAYAALGLQDATVSFELRMEKIARLGGTLPRGMLVYGYLPLMQLRCCPAQGKHGCRACDGSPTLTDRQGVAFPLLCQQRRYATLLNSVPLSLSGEPMPGVDFVTLRFTQETAAQCRRLTEEYMQGIPMQDARTRGLYHRSLQ